ncbi:hypothetical protein KSF73_08045 [Burkholderiaceae bacterium DAT-1]|nr:hypothetical protein [Burkholderiaceae bacterium DAT-1]
MPHQIIHLHRDAPLKPAFGAPCNGCGVCCAAEPCPVAMRRFKVRTGPCPALIWDASRYHCGLLYDTPRYWPKTPAWLLPVMRWWVARAISARSGCDSDVETDHSPSETR